MQAAFRSTGESFQSAWGLLIPEQKQQLHTSIIWIPRAIGGLFQNFSFTFRVPQYFLALARKVNDLCRFS